MLRKVHKVFLVAAALAGIVACAGPGFPGYVDESVSKFDDRRQLRMEPAWLYDSPVKLALAWHSDMARGKVLMFALVRGIHSIPQGESLYFNIDGEIIGVTTADASTEYDAIQGGVYNGMYVRGSRWSVKRYLVDTSVIDALLDATEVVARLDVDGGYAEGVFSTDMPTTARPAFREFRNQVGDRWHQQ